MADQNITQDVSKPLKTWSHLARNRRRPTEYEIVSTNMLWSTDEPAPWAQGPDIPMTKWYVKYRNNSPLQHDNWNDFRDPDQLVYRTYTILQDRHETFVDGLLDDYNKNEHDLTLSAEWVSTLARFYTPLRYLLHSVQMSAAYLVSMSPASTIENCFMFESADQLRWVSRVAYRTAELAAAHPGAGFGTNEREIWEKDPAWQGFREMMERILIAWDWGEQFVALNIVAKPAIDELLQTLGRKARQNQDNLLAFLVDAELVDSVRTQRFTTALVQYAREHGSNLRVLKEWTDKWRPYAEAALDAYVSALNPDAPREATTQAKRDAGAFCASLDL
jgi:toluene monooxygenase system protein E